MAARLKLWILGGAVVVVLALGGSAAHNALHLSPAKQLAPGCPGTPGPCLIQRGIN